MAIRFSNGFQIGATSGISPYWVQSTAGYTELTGGVSAPDDGYINNPIELPYNFFQDNNGGSTYLYVSTNGVLSLGSGYSDCCPNSPQANNYLFAGNPGDQFLNPGDTLSDGSTAGAWYKITDYGTDIFKVEVKVFNRELDTSIPQSYQINLYRDTNYQYMETWCKKELSTYGNPSKSGPYNSSDVSIPVSLIRNTWRSDLNGQNWENLGNVSVNLSPPSLSITGGYTTGGVTVSNSYNPYGPGSAYLLDGSTGYITITGNTDTAFGTGDFTIEWYQYVNTLNGHARPFSIGTYGGGCMIQVSQEGGSFYLRENNAWVASPPHGTILNTWVHFAIVRISGTTTIYRDGTSIYSFSDSNDLNDSSTNLNIGQESPATDGGAYFNGAITSFRWTKGLGIYTGDFQKPTGVLSVTASANPFGGSNTQEITAGYVKYLLQP